MNDIVDSFLAFAEHLTLYGFSDIYARITLAIEKGNTPWKYHTDINLLITKEVEQGDLIEENLCLPNEERVTSPCSLYHVHEVSWSWSWSRKMFFDATTTNTNDEHNNNNTVVVYLIAQYVREVDMKTNQWFKSPYDLLDRRPVTVDITIEVSMLHKKYSK